jgi:alkylated DNA repair dioxygenase AlkB
VANVRSCAVVPPPLAWQPSLFASPAPACAGGRGARWRRVRLDAESWLDVCAGFVAAPDELFDALLTGAPWTARTVTMYERVVEEPRLTAWLGEPLDAALEVAPALGDLAAALSSRYGVRFTSLGAALYRDGRDSVAWHGDRVGRVAREPLVAVVSLGAPRTFLVRPRGGGVSRRFVPHAGDALVMGGASQRRFEHAVPKVAHAGPRISVQLRHG